MPCYCEIDEYLRIDSDEVENEVEGLKEFQQLKLVLLTGDFNIVSVSSLNFTQSVFIIFF